MSREVDWSSDVSGRSAELGQTLVVLLLGGNVKPEKRPAKFPESCLVS